MLMSVFVGPWEIYFDLKPKKKNCKYLRDARKYTCYKGGQSAYPFLVLEAKL